MSIKDDMKNPLEDIKVQAALQSEYMKLEYRQKNRPDQVNILDYTVIAALERQVPKKPDEIQKRHNFRGDVIYKLGNCPVCKEESISNDKYCKVCGQTLDWRDPDETK